MGTYYLRPFLEKHFFTPILRADERKYSLHERCLVRVLKLYFRKIRAEVYMQDTATILSFFDSMLSSPTGKRLDALLRKLRLPTFASITGYMIFLGHHFPVPRERQSHM